jgi:hypothetical protein
MEVKYSSDVDVNLDEGDLELLLKGETVLGDIPDSKYRMPLKISIIPSEKNFQYKSEFDETSNPFYFRAWKVEEPREKAQMILPLRGGKINVEYDYGYLDITISKPVLIKVIDNRKINQESDSQFYGTIRGTNCGHIIDKVTLIF